MNDEYIREEPVSDAPDWGNLKNEERCPECGSNQIMVYKQDISDTQQETVYECKECGCTQTQK